MILSCTCTFKRTHRLRDDGGPRGADFQDVTHGSGRRVHNRTVSSDPVLYRCTICGTTRAAGKPKLPKG